MKFLSKTVISQPCNSIAFNGSQKYAKLYLNETEIIFVKYKSSISRMTSVSSHHNKSYDYENNNKYMQKPKIL